MTVSWGNIGHLRSDVIFTQGLVIKKKKKDLREFPGGPVVKTLHVHCRIAGVQWLRLCMSTAGLQGTQV